MSENQKLDPEALAALLGQRVREAREALGLNQDQLAQKVGIPRTALSAIEHGKRQVSSTELLRFGEVLQRPFDYFLRSPDPAPLSFQPLLRVEPLAAENETEEHRKAALAVQETLVQFEEICRSYADLEEMNQLPMPALPRPALDPGAHSARDAEQLADWVRTQLGLGQTVPAVQLRSLLEERYGIKTFVLRSPSKLSGASIYHPRIGGCVLVVVRQAPHMLFTLAHEAAHLLLHRDTPSVDEELFLKTPREQFANAFAASLLMPRAAVQDLYASLYRSRQELTPVEIAHMARHFGTSYSALLWRLQVLRLIGPAQREALLRRRAGEPAAPSAVRESWPALPERFLYLAARAYHQDRVTVGWLAQVLRNDAGEPMTRDEVREFLASYEAPEDGAATEEAAMLAADLPCNDKENNDENAISSKY